MQWSLDSRENIDSASFFPQRLTNQTSRARSMSFSAVRISNAVLLNHVSSIFTRSSQLLFDASEKVGRIRGILFASHAYIKDKED